MSSIPIMGAMALGASVAIFNSLFGSGPALISNEGAPPVEEPPLLASGNLRELVEMAEAYEQDPLPMSFLNFENGVKERADRENDGVVTIEMVKEQARCQSNPIEGYTMEIRTTVFEFAFTQSAKTNLMLFTVWKAGLQGYPSFVFAFNRTGERERFSRSLSNIDRILDTCAANLGLDPASVPRLKITGNDCGSDCESGSDEFVEDVKKFYYGGKKIPVFVVMSNDKKINSVQKTFSDASRFMKDDIDLDGNRKKMALMVLEEADLSIKDSSTGLYKALNERTSEYYVINEGADYVPEEGVAPSARCVKNVSVTDGFTSVVVITATPQVFGVVDGLFEGRNARLFKSTPSRHYWSYVRGDWECKLISTKVSEDHREMIADMVSSSDVRRHGLVCISGKGGTLRCLDQIAIAKRTARLFPGTVTAAWDGKGVHVYTTCPHWDAKFSGSRLFTGRSVCDEVVFEHIGQKSASRKEMVRNSAGGYSSLGCINSYIGLVTYMDEVSVEVEGEEQRNGVLTHTILFAYNMAQRSTPIKGYRHTWGLTDMFLQMRGAGGHDEARIQASGRLCSVDDTTNAKTLWGPAEDLEKLRNSFNRLSFFLEKMASGENTEALMQTLRDGMSDVAGGSTFHDASNVSNMDHSGLARKGVMGKAKREHKLVRSDIRAKRLRITAPAFVSDYAMDGPIEMPVAQAVAQPVAQPIVQPVVLEELSANQLIEEVVATHGSVLASTMADIVRTSDGPVTLPRMTTELSAHDNYPDGQNFNAGLLVRHLAGVDGLLQGVGLVFEDNVFSIVTLKSVFMGIVGSDFSPRKGIVAEFIRSHDDLLRRQFGSRWSADVTEKNHILRNYLNSSRMDEWGVEHTVVDNVYLVKKN